MSMIRILRQRTSWPTSCRQAALYHTLSIERAASSFSLPTIRGPTTANHLTIDLVYMSKNSLSLSTYALWNQLKFTAVSSRLHQMFTCHEVEFTDIDTLPDPHNNQLYSCKTDLLRNGSRIFHVSARCLRSIREEDEDVRDVWPTTWKGEKTFMKQNLRRICGMDQWQPTYIYIWKNLMIMCVPSPCKSGCGNAREGKILIDLEKMLLDSVIQFCYIFRSRWWHTKIVLVYPFTSHWWQGYRYFQKIHWKVQGM